VNNFNIHDVLAIAARMRGRCRGEPQYGTMLPLLLHECFKNPGYKIIDIGIGYYTTPVLNYLFGSRVYSYENGGYLANIGGPKIISWDGADRKIDPSYVVPGDIWVVHDTEADYVCTDLLGQASVVSNLLPQTKVFYV
jgi:hypothetical protein